jgi:hypothetical protein
VSFYAPLPEITSAADMARLASAPSAAPGAAFLARAVAPGGAARRAIDAALELIKAARTTV